MYNYGSPLPILKIINEDIGPGPGKLWRKVKIGPTKARSGLVLRIDTKFYFIY
jgi:hypothetical protein